MADIEWVAALDESAIRDGAINLAFAKGVSVIVIRTAGHLYALRNRCAHMSCTLAGGRLSGLTLQCPCHEWKFDITNGEFLDAREIRIPAYPCKAQDGKIYVKLEGA